MEIFSAYTDFIDPIYNATKGDAIYRPFILWNSCQI